MKNRFRFTIARKLGLGFSALTLAMLISSKLTYDTLNTNKQVIREITEVYSPSVTYLVDLSSMINNSKMLIKNWVYIDQKENTPDKRKLIDLHAEDYPKVEEKIDLVKTSWQPEDRAVIEEIFHLINDSLFIQHRMIMDNLNSFDKYQDPMVIMLAETMVEQEGDVILLTDEILDKLNLLMANLQEQTDEKNAHMIASFNEFQDFIFKLGGILLLAAIIIALLTTRIIIKPINRLKEFLISMSRGVLPNVKMKVNSDEIGDMAHALNDFVDNLQRTSNFAKEIGNANFNAEFTPLSDEDILGNSLLEMRANLVEADRKDKLRKHEDEVRNWSTTGVAKFAELLRQDYNNMEDFAYDIVSNLIHYVEGNLGGLFVLNEDSNNHKFIELLAFFAYDRRKYIEKRIEIGEGLIGRCVEEGETIFMTDIPKGYVKIASGMGEEDPASLLIVPLKINDDVYGVIEIASFKVFEKYEIEFVEKVGENIASTVSNVKINQRTKELLEESRIQSEELAAQEEELRQNMEELQATQEEASRKTTEMESLINSINDSGYVMELSTEGKILSVNKEYTNLYQTARESIVGFYEGEGLELLTDPDKTKDKFWGEIRMGQRKKIVKKIKLRTGTINLLETYTPILDEYRDVHKVLKIAFDENNFKQK